MYFNIFLEPFMVDPFLPDFHLLDISPCIDAGNPTLPLDPDSTICDIGALPFDQGSYAQPPAGQNTPDDFLLLSVYPNPFNPCAAIRYELSAGGWISLTIYSSDGREITRLIEGYRLAGVYEIPFDGSHLPSGLYFARLQSGENINVQKLLLLK